MNEKNLTKSQFTATDFGSLFAHKLKKIILPLETDQDETIHPKS